MNNKNYFILLGSPEDTQHLIKSKEVHWTAMKQCKTEDVCFFYIVAPISAIVAQGVIDEAVWKNCNPNSRWKNRWIADVYIQSGIADEKPHVSMRRLRELFPEWNWLRLPRQNTQIPADIVKPFLELMK